MLSIFFLILTLAGAFGEHHTIVKLQGQRISVNIPNAKVTHGSDGSLTIEGNGFKSFSAPSTYNGPKPDWVEDFQKNSSHPSLASKTIPLKSPVSLFDISLISALKEEIYLKFLQGIKKPCIMVK